MQQDYKSRHHEQVQHKPSKSSHFASASAVAADSGLKKPLTRDMVTKAAMKAQGGKGESTELALAQVKSINMWGNDIDDLSILCEMKSLEIVSLSLNKVSSLRDFAHCINIKEIYLRKNNICDLKEISHLAQLSRLRVLWLSHNPCAEHKYYRAYAI